MAETTDVKNSQIEALDVPEDVKDYLQELVDGLKSKSKDNLVSAIIYGGIARGHYRPRKSDINLLILFKSVSQSALDAVSEILHEGRIRFALAVMVMTPDEVQRSADVFPVKFLHIKNYHVVLTGEDLFSELVVSPKHVRLRLEQELRNISVRLRNRYINIHTDEVVSSKMIAQLVSSLAVQLRTLMELCQKPLPPEHTTSANIKAAAKAFCLDEEALLAATEIRLEHDPKITINEIFGRIMSSVDKAVTIVDELEVK